MKKTGRRVMQLMLIMACALAGTGCSKKEEINISDYLEVTFEGVDGYGTLSYDTGLDEMWEDVADILDEDTDDEDFEELVSKFEKRLEYEFSSQEALSNGDEITIEIDWSDNQAENFDVVFTGEEKTVVVEGLKEIEELDVFADINLKYEGTAPFLNVRLENNSEAEWKSYVRYEVQTGDELLYNGSEVKVAVTYYDEATLLRLGYKLGETEKVYTVSGVNEYITKASQLDKDALLVIADECADPAYEIMDYAKTYYEYAGNSLIRRWTDTSINSYVSESTDLEVYEMHFFSAKDVEEQKNSRYGATYNSVFVIYAADVTINNKQYRTYIPVYYRNLVVADDGTLMWGEASSEEPYTLDQADGFDYDKIISQIKTDSNMRDFNYELVTREAFGLGDITEVLMPTPTPMPEIPRFEKVSGNVYEVSEAALTEVGDVVVLGKFEQDNDLENGAESVEWIVLAKEENRVLLLSRYSLLSVTFSDRLGTTWDASGLRMWLNDTFYNSVFTSDEAAYILETVNNSDSEEYGISGGAETTDKVFLLSAEEVERHFASYESRLSETTKYCRETSAYNIINNTYHEWWLRTVGYGRDYATTVKIDGRINEFGSMVSGLGNVLRPAMWITTENVEANTQPEAAGNEAAE